MGPPRGRNTGWKDVGAQAIADVANRLNQDASKNGFPGCVVVHETERSVTIQLRYHGDYFSGKVDAIIARLR